MREHRYRIVVVSSAAPTTVFAVLADAPRWHEWAGTIGASSYEREGDPAPHGVGAVRCFGAGFGPTSREEVVVFDPPRRLSYEIRSGPLPVHGYRSDVELVASGSGTLVTWRGRYRTAVPGLAWVLRRLVTGFARDLVAEAERRSAVAP
jgi:hypothetical protein